MKIFDNVVSEEGANNLEKLFLTNTFPWYLIKKSSGDSAPLAGFNDTVQMEHTFINGDSIQSPLIHEVMKNLNWSNVLGTLKLNPEILRMKSNLLFKTQPTPNTPHIDLPQPHTVLLYYVNDSSGPTVFYKKYEESVIEIKRVIPRKGRLVMFDGNTLHASTPPTHNDYRCVINFDLKPNSLDQVNTST